MLYAVCGTKVLNIADIQAGIDAYIRMRESIDVVPNKLDNRSSTMLLYAAEEKAEQKNSGKKGQNSKPKRSLLKNSNTQAEKSSGKEPRCTFCREPHYASDCPKFVTLSAHKAAINRLERCDKCFGKHTECTRATVCPLCLKVNSHHRVLCPTLYEGDKRNSNLAMTSSASKKAPKSVSLTISRTGMHTTMKILFINPVTNWKYKLRALLDQGANSSFISEMAARAIGPVSYTHLTLPTIYSV